MKTLTPAIQKDTQSLTPHQLVQFLKLSIDTAQGTSTFLLTDGVATTWRGEVWSRAPFLLAGISSSATGERSRPKLTLPNEEGMFSYFVNNRLLEGAEVIRYLVHPLELQSGTYLRNVWYASQVVGMDSVSVTLQLRRYSDGNQFRLPSRRYVQPEFRTVVL